MVEEDVLEKTIRAGYVGRHLQMNKIDPEDFVKVLREVKQEPAQEPGKLKPCPSCKSGRVKVLTDYLTTDMIRYHVVCQRCCLQHMIYAETRQEAIEAWNSLPRQQEIID